MACRTNSGRVPADDEEIQGFRLCLLDSVG